MNLIEMSPLMDENPDAEGGAVINHGKFDQLSKTLQLPMGGENAPRPPASLTDGEKYGEGTAPYSSVMTPITVFFSQQGGQAPLHLHALSECWGLAVPAFRLPDAPG